MLNFPLPSMSRRLIFVVPFVLALTGCTAEALFDRFVPQEEAALARQLVARVAARDFAAVEAQLAPNLRTPDVRRELEAVAGQVPPGEPLSVRTVGAHTSTDSTGSRFDLTHEYQYPSAWLVARTVLERREGQIVVQGLHLTRRAHSLVAENAFTLAGKSPLHYVVLLLALGIPLFVIYALAVCIRTRLPKRKWLWLLFVAVGFVQFQFDWTTGAWAVQPISLLLLGAGFLKSGPAGPVIFSLAFPLGALIFLTRRRALATRGRAPEGGPPAPQRGA